MKKTTVLLAATAFALGGLVAAYALLADRPNLLRAAAPQPIWQEVR